MLNINVGASDNIDLLRQKEEIGGIVGVMTADQVKSTRAYIENVLLPNSQK